MPQRRKRGGPHPPLDDQSLEGLQVMRFLGRHMADFRRRGVPLAQHRQLPRIDPYGAVFAGMVDPDDPVDQGLARRVAGYPARAGSAFGGGPSGSHRRDRAATSASSPIASDAMAL